MTAQHTPGPWRFDEGMYSSPIKAGKRGFLIAEVHSYSTTIKGQPHREERIANARLMAAAPDLLKALKTLIDCGNAIIGATAGDPQADDAFQMYDDARLDARDVITKATVGMP